MKTVELQDIKLYQIALIDDALSDYELKLRERLHHRPNTEDHFDDIRFKLRNVAELRQQIKEVLSCGN